MLVLIRDILIVGLRIGIVRLQHAQGFLCEEDGHICLLHLSHQIDFRAVCLLFGQSHGLLIQLERSPELRSDERHTRIDTALQRVRLPHLDPVIGEEAPHGRARAAHITEVDLLLLEHIAIGAREADLRQERATILLLIILRPVDTEEGSL